MNQTAEVVCQMSVEEKTKKTFVLPVIYQIGERNDAGIRACVN